MMTGSKGVVAKLQLCVAVIVYASPLLGTQNKKKNLGKKNEVGLCAEYALL